MPPQDARESLHHVPFYNDPRYENNLPASTDPLKRRPGGYKVNAIIPLVVHQYTNLIHYNLKPKRSTCERQFLNYEEYLKPPFRCFLAPSEKDVRYADNRFYEEITDVCCHVFGVDVLRSFQLPSMTAALEGFDIILNTATGSGKSLGYQVCR